MSKTSVMGPYLGVWLGVIGLCFGVGCATTASAPTSDSNLRKAASHLDLGVDHLSNDRVAHGLRELLVAESLDPQNARIQHALGDGYLMRGKTVKAEQHYLRALELMPTLHDPRLNLAGLYCQLGRYEECLDHSRQLAEDAIYPMPWRALTNQGWAEVQLHRLEDARTSLEMARNYRSDYWPMLLNLGILETEDGNRLEAVELFQQVLDQRPGSEVQSEANYRIGEIYIELGDRKQAVSHLMAAVADAPGGRWGVKSEEYLKRLR